MISLIYKNKQQPYYATLKSAGADLKARKQIELIPGEVEAIPTGVWVDKVYKDFMPVEAVPELQIRARSGLALKYGIMLANGVGTVDIDYPDEIAVLLYNSSKNNFKINVGDRIAQLVLSLTYRISNIPQGKEERVAGFGSTGVK